MGAGTLASAALGDDDKRGVAVLRWPIAIGCCVVLVSVLAACDGASGPVVPSASTGIAAVDEVILAIAEQDTDALVAPARDGVVPDLGWAMTDGECHTITVDDPADAIEAFVADGPSLYGVFEGPGVPPDEETRPPAAWIRGAYWLVYSMPLEAGEFTNPGARVHVDEDGAIVGLWVPCRGVPEWLTHWDQERLTEIELQRPDEHVDR